MNKDDVIAIIRSLLSSTASSLSVSDLNNDFKNETGIDIPVFGHGNITDFLRSIPETVKLTGQQVALVTNEKSAHIVSLVKRQKSVKLNKEISCLRRRPTSKKAEISRRSAAVQEPSKISSVWSRHSSEERDDGDEDFLSRLSKNDFCTDERIPPIDLTIHAPVGEYIEVRPCAISNPHDFYFHFRKFKKKIINFMNDLQSFYESHEEIPKIDPRLMRPEQTCAALHRTHEEGIWYRAEIQKILSDSHVDVSFVDFGSGARIPKEDLRFLHRNFISLPRQACSGSLANIRPSNPGSGWSACAIKRFRDLTFQKDLVAGVVHADAEAHRTSLALSLTRGTEIHINDTLVKEGFAEFEAEVSHVRSESLSKERSELNESETGPGPEQGLARETSTSSKNRDSCQTRKSVFYFPYGDNDRLKKLCSWGREHRPSRWSLKNFAFQCSRSS